VDLLHPAGRGIHMAKIVTIKFYPNTKDVKEEHIDQGIIVIATSYKYIVVHCTIDEDVFDTYDDLEALIIDLERSYGEEVAREVEKRLRK